jgi:hypothetical protein
LRFLIGVNKALNQLLSAKTLHRHKTESDTLLLALQSKGAASALQRMSRSSAVMTISGDESW